MIVEQNEIDYKIELVDQALDVLRDWDTLYDLVGRRLAWWSLKLKPTLDSKSFRVGVVGHPNRGKTTLTYTLYTLLKNYRLQTHYVDLDVYTQSGPAIAGEIGWDERNKRSQVPKSQIRTSLAGYTQYTTGLTLGDFPGNPHDKHQGSRLKMTDLAVILIGDDQRTELIAWQRLTAKTSTPCIWMHSSLHHQLLEPPIYPLLRSLRREVKPFSIPTIVFATALLINVATILNLDISDIWNFYTEPERVVLEEVLTLLFAPLE